MLEKQIKNLMKEGIYGYHDLFNRIYPTYFGHYYTLRQEIARIKNA